EWLEPDWMIDMATREFVMFDANAEVNANGHSMGNGECGMGNERATSNACDSPIPIPDSPFPSRRRLRRPEIKLEIRRCHHSAWRLFARHHYLSGGLSKSARCYIAQWSVDSGQGSVESTPSQRDGKQLITDHRPLTA